MKLLKIKSRFKTKLVIKSADNKTLLDIFDDLNPIQVLDFVKNHSG